MGPIYYSFTGMTQVSALCLVSYDTLLTLSREVEHIWMRKLSLVTTIYFLQRWMLVLNGIVTNLPTDYLWSITANICTILALVGIAAFSTLRIWAIWGHEVIPTLSVLVTSALVPALNISFTVDDGDCDVNYALSPEALSRRTFLVAIAARAAAIASDVLVLILTWIKTEDVWRESARMQGFKYTLSTPIFRNGTLYFGMMLILNIAALALDRVQPDFGGGTSFIAVVNAVSANLISRFILDLRSVYDEKVSFYTTSTIRFDVQSLACDISAPLGTEDSTWYSGPSDDVVITGDREREAEGVALSVYPRAGLATEAFREEDLTYGNLLIVLHK
ncbi:hypothetical protein EIP91_000862 [Steccherinum ochraceum]|uniref:DUF6533 domain-containing protein n=1 Tax=Steccherinum ochraceum TaxID=92696 RepID=A0A4R0RVZ9_9APHY|nr:hypothetical protein EIP91_000862 [Steccherinum ochraceum]